MRFELPLPPSINNYYTNHRYLKRRIKTNKAREWEQEAGYELVRAKIKRFKGRVYVGIHWYFKRDRDIDNCLKALLDLLQKQRIIDNDSQVYQLNVTKGFDKGNPRVEIEIEKMV